MTERTKPHWDKANLMQKDGQSGKANMVCFDNPLPAFSSQLVEWFLATSIRDRRFLYLRSSQRHKLARIYDMPEKI